MQGLPGYEWGAQHAVLWMGALHRHGSGLATNTCNLALEHAACCPPQAICAACVVLGCRDGGVTRTFKEICAGLSDIPKKDIAK